ncbi:HK97-gp10 family putative phage morphogenesis protein [Aureimonas psammosilenae]|uniref:HK97-gp10 family putative phage morphogenesis protein n=1 Tax=Aureimonas psammosilenae TaxID=2495496 RepID=UPI001AEE35E8|nr:HK97-gp10 family putative phage morphogenesis protein [Aureimonas psammosilenae]
MAKAEFTPFAAKLSNRLTSLVDQALFVAGKTIETEAALSITEGSVTGKNHVPSAPGQPPNADTRQLDKSIDTLPVQDHEVEVVATAPYAKHLEYGTSKMEPRPFMRPALAKNEQKARDLIAKAVNKATEGKS